MSDYDSYERQADVLKLIWDSVLKTLQLITPTLSEAKNVEELHFGEKHARSLAKQTSKLSFSNPKGARLRPNHRAQHDRIQQTRAAARTTHKLRKRSQQLAWFAKRSAKNCSSVTLPQVGVLITEECDCVFVKFT